MTTPSTIKTRIEEIDLILQSGAKSITVDGITTTYDLDSLRTERAELEKQLPDKPRRRPFVLKPRISG